MDGGDAIPGMSRHWDQPDIKKNPNYWLKLYLEGLTLHRRSFALAARADRILDLGCGGGWFSIHLARKRNDLLIDAVDTDGRLLDWGRLYVDRLNTKGENLGKIDSGELIKISPTKIPRLTGSVIQTIEASTNATITVGQNGLIILKCDNSTGLKKSIASIKMIGMAQYDANLEEKIQRFLDENN